MRISQGPSLHWVASISAVCPLRFCMSVSALYSSNTILHRVSSRLSQEDNWVNVSGCTQNVSVSSPIVSYPGCVSGCTRVCPSLLPLSPISGWFIPFSLTFLKWKPHSVPSRSHLTMSSLSSASHHSLLSKQLAQIVSAISSFLLGGIKLILFGYLPGERPSHPLILLTPTLVSLTLDSRHHQHVWILLASMWLASSCSKAVCLLVTSPSKSTWRRVFTLLKRLLKSTAISNAVFRSCTVSSVRIV